MAKAKKKTAGKTKTGRTSTKTAKKNTPATKRKASSTRATSSPKTKKAASTRANASKSNASKSKTTKSKASKSKASKSKTPAEDCPVEETTADETVTLNRRKADRRGKTDSASGSKRPAHEKLERRAKVNRRRQIDPTTCERDYSDEEIEFMNAMELYKRQSGRMFPTCSEVLEVLRGLGYVKRNEVEAGVAADQVVAGGQPDVNPAAEGVQGVSAEATTQPATDVPVAPVVTYDTTSPAVTQLPMTHFATPEF